MSERHRTVAEVESDLRRLADLLDHRAALADHHAQLWRETLAVERRDLAVYEDAAQWN